MDRPVIRTAMPSRRLVVVMGLSFVALSVAGCVQETPGDGEEKRPATLMSDARFGLKIHEVQLHGSLRPGEVRTWKVEARNSGPPGDNPIHYREGCGDPWTVELRDEVGRPVAWQEPMAQCQGFQEKRLTGGEKHPFEWTWNGKVWDEARGDYEDAAEGTYSLAVAFEGMHAGTHDATVSATTGLQVR